MAVLYLRSFDEELKKEAKIQAIREGLKIGKLVEKAIREYLAKKGGKENGMRKETEG